MSWFWFFLSDDHICFVNDVLMKLRVFQTLGRLTASFIMTQPDEEMRQPHQGRGEEEEEERRGQTRPDEGFADLEK